MTWQTVLDSILFELTKSDLGTPLLQARSAISHLPPSDRSFVRLLCDAPALPPAVLALLQAMLLPPPSEADAATPSESGPRSGGDTGYLERVTQSLSALWALILQRPLLREQCLDISLKVSVFAKCF
jgi:symplekin